MTTKYPGILDDNLSLPKAVDNVSPIVANDVNQLQEAIVAIQTELGVNPSGVSGTVADRISTISTSTTANVVTIVDSDGYFASSNVEGALQELGAVSSSPASSIILTDADGYYVSSDVEGALQEIGNGTALRLGFPEDSTYNDGLFTDFTENTRLGIAIDRFNDVLGSLSPPPAPTLSDISFTTSLGISGKVSFGTSNIIAGYTSVGTAGGGTALDINGSFTSGSGSALRKGVYASGTNKIGIIADAVVADTGSPTISYPANAFGNGNLGSLVLELNGTDIHTTNLTSFGSGNSLNGNGSGFTSLLAATSISFPSGDTLDLFKYRTGGWVVDSSETNLVNGWNYVRIRHIGYGNTNYFEWIVDADVTATSFASESLGAMSMTGSKSISGVSYHTGGTGTYGITVSNLHRNTYSSSASAISHTTSTNLSIPNASLGTISAESNTEVISKTATINVIRLINASVTGKTLVDRVVQTDLISTGSSQTELLMDNQSDDASNTVESLNGELFRVASNKLLTDITGYNSGGNDALWDQTLSLLTGGAGYNDGILKMGGQLLYPNSSAVPNNGDFSAITNGPAGNPNYSTATGTRVYIRYFYFSSISSNYVLNINGTGTVVNAGSVTSSTNEVSVEFLLPNTTTNGSSIEYKDGFQNYTSDTNIGCGATTYGASIGSLTGQNWGISFGGKNNSTSGNAVVIKLSVAQGWTGSIDSISLVAA